jgi:NitT/TauT family transport system substrate-binding protein
VSISQQTKNQDGATVITKAPDADAYSNDYVTKALALVKANGVDAVGASFQPITVTLEEGGA